MEPKPRTRGRDLDHVAWLYDPLIEKLSFGRERRFREKTIEHMNFKRTDRILDVGCGTGSLTLAVARLMEPPGEAVGIDAAPRMIARARKKAEGAGLPVSFVVGVSESLPFDDGSFHMVVNSMFTHHLDADLKERSFGEMFRVLRAGGSLLTADIDKPANLLAWLIGWTTRYVLVQRELVDNLRGELPSLMEGAGFREVVKLDNVYGMVSFFRARKPGAAA